MHIFNKAACGLPLLLSLMSTNGWATTLSEALSAAENYSAELSANDHQVNALKNMADSAMQLPDPKLKFGIENVPLGGNNAGRLTREGMTMQRVGVMQDYVSSTKRERKADSITAEARQTAANADVIRARLQRETAQARLLQLTGKEVRDISGPLPRIERLPADEADLMAGIKLHPEVIQAAREADLAKAKSGQSEVAAIPDVGVEVYYARRGDDYDDMVGVMFTVDMPIFQGKRQDKDHAADVSRTYEANDRLTLLMREHQAQQYQLISQYNAAKAIYDRQQSEVLPLLRKKVSLVNAQYRGGSSALPELLAARRDLLSGEIASNNAEKALADAWAAIRYLIPQDVK